MTPGPGERDSPRWAAAEWLRARLKRIVDEVIHRLADEVPDYARFLATETSEAELRQTVRQIGEAFLALLVEGRRLSDEELAVVIEVGLRRAREGFTLSSVSDAVHVAMSVARHELRECCEAVSCPRAIETEMLDALSDFEHDLVGGFQEGFRYFEGEESGQRDAFLQEIAEEGISDPADAIHRAAGFGFPLDPPITVVLLIDDFWGEAIVGGTSDHRSVVARARASLRALGAPPLGPAPIEPDDPGRHFAIALFRTESLPEDVTVADRLARGCTEGGLVAVFATAHALDELQATIQRLRATLPILPSLVEFLGRAMTPASVRPWRRVSALWVEEQEDLVRTFLGPILARLTARSAAKHLETLKVFIATECNVAETARRLSSRDKPLSETGARKRIQTIERLTGREIRAHVREFEDALRVFELFRHSFPPAGDPWWSATLD